MDNPTICAKCKHIMPTNIEHFKCAASFEDRLNYVTGETERMKKPNEWVWCNVKNRVGKCPDYEPKEVIT